MKKTQTRTIFDRDKVAKGDIVEYDVQSLNPFRKNPKVLYRAHGFVKKVEDETLWICALDSFSNDVAEFGLPVEREDISILKRHAQNLPKNKRK